MRLPAPDFHRALDPLAAHPVELVVEGGWRLAVRPPESVGDDTLDLTAPEGGPLRMPGGLTSCPATLEWRSVRGLVQRAGELRAGPDGRLVLASATEPVVVQRREFARVHVAVRALVTASDGDVVATRTVDLSVGGALLEQAGVLELGERVEIVLVLDDGDLRARGTVVRATRFGHRAICFDPWTYADERRIARFVMDQERQGRSAVLYQ